ncbi:MAG: hypothetical protein GTN36_01915 [Candidatus Aenigmarchaeota archaeon]|nr:hypothetical protein [Candidatus Aenigmarchaeota archaeon]
MKKILSFMFLALVLISSPVVADNDMMDFEYGGGMMGGTGMFGMAALGLAYAVIIAFVFSIIFWLTYNLVVKRNKK